MAYVEAKERIALRQTREEWCVLNYENAYTRDFGMRCPAKVVFFSSARELSEGYFLKEEQIFQEEDSDTKNIYLSIHFDFSGLYIVLKVFVIVFQRQEWIIIQVFCVDRISFCLMYESTYL